MAVTSNCVRSVAVVICLAALWLAARHAPGAEPGTLQPALESPVPTPQPPMAAEPAVPVTADPWPASGDVDSDFFGPFGRYQRDTAWFRADYLLWWTTGARIPPLVTTSPQGTGAGEAGVLGAAGTTVLFGGQTVDGDARSGFRTTVGLWLDDWHRWDVEFDYFSPGGRSASFNETSNGDPILARPYFNVQTNQQESSLAAYTGVATGTVTADARDYFQSFGLSVAYNLGRYTVFDPFHAGDLQGEGRVLCFERLDLLGAFRYYGLYDRVSVGQNLVLANAFGYQDVGFADLDDFDARNDFYGGEIGLRSRMYRGRWSLEVSGKVALGANCSVVNVAGATAITPPGGPTVPINSGLLAAPSNMGTYNRDVFTAIPQLGVQLGYQWNNHWETHVGYTLLYWNEVTRAGDQIDLNLDLSGANTAPIYADRTTYFLAQGWSVGAEFRF